ncbi:MAG TPA: MFS transporter [Candidatus Acidoferrales bacterium]|nr:MFS transporter [Candidatus Acidoferrales bacterium]
MRDKDQGPVPKALENEPAGRTPIGALRHRDFSIYWAGSVVSQVGTQFTTVAMAWQIYELTNSPLQLGLLGLARAAPMLALLLFGGLLADAVNRRHLMMATQIAQMGVSASLALMTLAGMVSPAVLYVASLFLALFSALEQPARTAIIPNLVPRSDLSNALALSGVQRYLATIVGPSLAGLLLARSGAMFCYTVDAVSWLAMLAALLIMRPLAQATGGRRAITMQALREGVEFVWTHPVILSMMALDFGQNFFGSGRALLPIYAKDILAVGPQGLGLLYSATSAGAVLMGTVMSMRAQVRRAGAWVIVSVSFYGIFMMLFGVSHFFWFSFLMLASAGAANTVSFVLRNTINQVLTPDEIRGRVTSVNSMFTNTGPQLGQFEAGALASLIGPVAATAVGGLVVTSIAAGLAAVASVRAFEVQEHAPAKIEEVPARA